MKKSFLVISILLAACSEAPPGRAINPNAASISADSKSGDKQPSGSDSKDTSTDKDPPVDDSKTSDTKSSDMGDNTKNESKDPPVTTEPPKVELSPTTGIAKVAVVASPGCNKEPTQALGKYFQKKVSGMDRTYQLYLPPNYDKTKPYRLFILGHGCGGKDAPFKMETVSKEQAILVASKSAGSCFVYDMKVEGPYFDELLKEVSNDVCVDSNRVFVAGFSSGSWLTNMLGCARSNVIRAQGNASGALPGGLPTCQGTIPAFMVHDDKDNDNKIEG